MVLVEQLALLELLVVLLLLEVPLWLVLHRPFRISINQLEGLEDNLSAQQRLVK